MTNSNVFAFSVELDVIANENNFVPSDIVEYCIEHDISFNIQERTEVLSVLFSASRAETLKALIVDVYETQDKEQQEFFISEIESNKI